MQLRLIEMACPEDRADEVEEVAREYEPLELWRDQMADAGVLIKIVLQAQQAEGVLDELENRFGGMDGFRVLLTRLEAVVPRPEPPEESQERASSESASKSLPTRISRQELYSDVSAACELTRVFLALIGLATIVAALGLWRGDVAVIVGAMVIAPLLGPNIALALAATLGDGELGRRAFASNLAGIGLAFGLAVFMGVILPFGSPAEEFLARARVAPTDVVLALAAGSAGALAFTTGIPTALVGVMVAVALLPPLAALGLAVGSVQWNVALGALLLFTSNLVCINLAGMATFLIQGIRPRTWWEEDRAKKASRSAMTLWILLLFALLALMLVVRSCGAVPTGA